MMPPTSGLVRAARRLLIAILFAVVAFGGWVGGISPALDRSNGTPGRVDDVAAQEPTPAPSSTPALSSLAPLPTGTSGVGASASSSPGPTGPAPSGTALAGGPTATAALEAVLDAHLLQWRAKTATPGVSVSISFADGTTWNGTAGVADVKAGRAVTPDTAFPVASVSKTFTSALILGLVADGKLALDRSARSYLPSLPIDKRITIRELLDHTSGLRDFFLDPKIDKALQSDRTRTWDPTMSLRYIRKPLGTPGTIWHYSNTNYLVLGMIAEVVGGAPVADQLRSRFLGPLGLDATWYQAVERPRAPLATAYRLSATTLTAKPVSLSDGSSVSPFTSVVTAAGAAGSIASTAGDLAQWARALYGGDALDPVARSLLLGSPAGTARLHPPVPYGFAMQSITIAGQATLGHSGRFLGARGAIRWLPLQQVAIAVLTNQSRADPGVLVADLLKVLFPPAPRPAATHAAPTVSKHP
jgi:CubicO group peptidase (beta-lactamase class C family)